MFKWEAVKLENLTDVIRWHQHHLALAQKRFASRATSRYSPLQIRRLQKHDQRQIDLHASIVRILEASSGQIQGLEDELERGMATNREEHGLS